MIRFIDVTDYLNQLEKAINKRDKRTILDIYEHNIWNWDEIAGHLCDRYDQLVEQANEIVYE